MKYPAKSVGLAVALFGAWLAVGCANLGSGSSSPLASARCVGGGLMGTYATPERGVVYLVDATSGKILNTASVEAGEPFEWDIDLGDDETLQRLHAYGVAPDGADFRLYFRPEPAVE